jgi:hypothetical protein
MDTTSFEGIAIVACGTLRMELKKLQDEGFLNTEHLFFTAPGLHQDIRELEKQLVQQIAKAKEKTDKVIVVYGGKFCYVNADDPLRTMQTIIDEQGPAVVRIQATHCMDMIADKDTQANVTDKLAGGEPVFFMTPGWVKFRHLVFKGWDKGIANENFPRHTGGVIVLDGLGYLDTYMEENPEEFLDYCDWMGVPMQGCPCSLDRLKSLLSEQATLLENPALVI